ncbi:hypothetical protein Tco_0272764 [Tanacetum coccineum]
MPYGKQDISHQAENNEIVRICIGHYVSDDTMTGEINRSPHQDTIRKRRDITRRRHGSIRLLAIKGTNNAPGSRTELTTLGLTCPLTYQLLRSSHSCFGPNMSFDMPASSKYLSSLARASLAEIDIDLYHSRLTQGDLNELIIKYKIPRDLHPRLPSKDFVLSKLPDDAIGVYHRIFNFFGVHIPFSSFLLALIKHYKVHFTKLGPLGLNKRHPDLAIDDPKPVVGSYRMADVRRLSAHVVKLMDMPGGVGLIRVESCLEESDFYGFPFYCTPPITVDAVVPNPTPEELAVSNPSAKVIAKAEASQNTTHTNLFADNFGAESDDDDACYEIYVVTPIRSDAMITPSGNQGGGSTAPTAEGLNTQDSQGKGIITNADVVAAPFRQITGLNYNLSALDASFAKSKAKGKEREKKIKSLTKSLDNLHAGVAHLSADLNRATVLEAKNDEEILRLKVTPSAFASFFRGQFQALVRKFLASDKFSRVQAELLCLAASAGFERGLSIHQTKEEFVVVLKKISYFLEPEKLAHPANVLALRDACVSPPIAKELTVTLSSTSLEFLSNTVPTSSAAALEPNEEWVNAIVDERDNKMVDAAANAKSECVSSGPGDVVVALSAGEKGDGSVPSSTFDEGRGAWYAEERLLLQAWGKLPIDVWLSIQRILSHATRPKPNGFPWDL